MTYPCACIGRGRRRRGPVILRDLRVKLRAVDLVQKTSNSKITVHYPNHPLAGQTFEAVHKLKGPPLTFVVILPNKARAAIPEWMTEPFAAEVLLESSPLISAHALLEVAHIVSQNLRALDSSETLLHDDSKPSTMETVSHAKNDSNPSVRAQKEIQTKGPAPQCRQSKGNRRVARPPIGTYHSNPDFSGGRE